MAALVVTNDLDRRIWEEELAAFVPPAVFDVHTHVYDWAMTPPEGQAKANALPAIWRRWPASTAEILDQVDAALLPGRRVSRLCFGNPLQECDQAEANAFAARQAAADPASAALMLVRPSMSPDAVATAVERWGFLGFKPYRLHSVTGDAAECRITDFLPEAQLDVADRYGLIVMLHLSKSRAIGDPENLADLDRLSSRFPRVRWVLAHAARSYYDRPLLAAREILLRLPNLRYEISSVCDTDVFDVLLEIAGPDRVMYGSDDLPVGAGRGKYITFGRAWAALDEENHRFNLGHCDGRMTFVRYESLRAFTRACRRHGYGRPELEKVFHANARDLVEAARGSARARMGKGAGP